MFFTPSNLKSSAVSDIQVSPDNGQVIVKYTNDTKSYLYNVDFEAIDSLLSGAFKSIGKFVNVWCKEEGDLVATIN